MPQPTRSLHRALVGTGIAIASASLLVVPVVPVVHAQPGQYKDPSNPALPVPGMTLDLSRTALVVIDPQIDFVSPKGAAWAVVGESVTEQELVPNLLRLFEASKRAGIVVAISPHYYYPHDHRWKFGGPAKLFQHNIKILDRASALSLEGFHAYRTAPGTTLPATVVGRRQEPGLRRA